MRGNFSNIVTTGWWPIGALLVCAVCLSVARADEPGPETASAPGAALEPQVASLESSEGFQNLITSLVRGNIPHEFEEHDGWGETRERWDGVKIWWEGLQLKTKRRKKEVKHGTWKRYQVRLVDPEQRFQIRLEDVRTGADSRPEFTVRVDARLAAFARLAQWEYGVQLIALSANAQADIRFRATCSLGSRLDPSRFPPDLLLEPEVTDADLELVDFRLQRVSQLNGSLAHELGKALHDVIEDRIDKEDRRLPEKINRQIDKNRDRLRFSIRDVLDSQWGGLATSLLGTGADADPAAPD
jgi:hypothetical protein